MTDAERKKAFEKARSAELRARAALLTQTREDVIKLLNEALAEIKALLADVPTEYEMYRLPQLQKQIEQTLVTFGNHSADVLAQGATQAWAGGQALATAPLEAAGIRIAASLPALDTRLLMAMSNFMVDRIQDVGAQAAAKIKSQLGLVLIGAQSPGEAIGTITAILGEESRERAITIARTELGRVHAVAAQQRMEQAAKHVPGLQKQWRRSGKIHSRENHDAIDGQIQPVGKPFALVAKKDGLPLFMMHPHDPAAPAGEVINCGCVAIPFKNEWKVLNPGKMPFSELELQHNPLKREIAAAKAGPVKVKLLPNHEKAVIDERKLINYALNPDHSVGAGKARRFKAALGFDATNAQELTQTIREQLPQSKAIAGLADKHGQRYAIDMELTGPAGKAVVRTAWIVDGENEAPRLVSAYVKRS